MDRRGHKIPASPNHKEPLTWNEHTSQIEASERHAMVSWNAWARRMARKWSSGAGLRVAIALRCDWVATWEGVKPRRARRSAGLVWECLGVPWLSICRPAPKKKEDWSSLWVAQQETLSPGAGSEGLPGTYSARHRNVSRRRGVFFWRGVTSGTNLESGFVWH